MTLPFDVRRRAKALMAAFSPKKQNIRLAISISIILATACLTHLSGQTVSSSPEDVVRVDTSLVAVPVIVTDRQKRRVVGLTAKDFDVKDQGEPVQITFFSRGTERVAVVFALDASGSARGIARQQRLAAEALFAQLGPKSTAAVLRFADEPEVAVPFTNDKSRVQEAFLTPPLEGHRTAVFNAAAAAVKLFSRIGSDKRDRRIIILMSDGLDTVSTTTAQAVIERAVADGISFYIIHLPLFWPRDGELVARPASKGFKELAQKTGGRYFVVGTPALALDPRATYDLTPVYQAIRDDLNSQYVLGYYLPEERRDGRVHRIQVGFTRKDNQWRATVMRGIYTAGS